jgi:hypothetical protein
MMYSLARCVACLLGAGIVAAPVSAALAAGPEVFITSVTAGIVDPNGKVPTLNGVPGSGVNNYDIADPVAVLQNGTMYVIGLSSQGSPDFRGFSATACASGGTPTAPNTCCTDTYELMQGTVTLASGTIGPASYQCGPNSYFIWLTTTAAIPRDEHWRGNSHGELCGGQG